MQYHRDRISRTNSRIQGTQIHKKVPISSPIVAPELNYAYVRKVGKKSIVHVVYPAISIPPKNYGGVEKEIYLLAKEQAKRGYDVYVFAHPESVIPGCKIIPCPSCGNTMGQIQADMVLKFIQRCKPDVIHDHSPWGLLGSRNCHCPVIRGVYGDPFKLYVATVRSDTTVVFTTKAFATFYGYPNAPIIRMAIDENLKNVPFCPVRKATWALFVGKMEEIKGPQTAIAWAKKTNRTLVMLGPIFNLAFFDTQVRTHVDYSCNTIKNAVDLANALPTGKIIYGGTLRQVDFWVPYLAAGVTFVPSECEEAMSMVVQEAMLTGCPVIATNRGGIFESMGEGIGGRVVSSTDEVAMYLDTLNHWYQAKEARDYILTTRTPEVMVDSCDEIYRKVMK